jgi:hypothetical protein
MASVDNLVNEFIDLEVRPNGEKQIVRDIESPRRQREVVADEVLTERARQDQKWGQQNHDDPLWLAILAEEFGEVAKDVVENQVAAGVREELIQTAAVCIAWVEAIDRR